MVKILKIKGILESMSFLLFYRAALGGSTKMPKNFQFKGDFCTGK